MTPVFTETHSTLNFNQFSNNKNTILYKRFLSTFKLQNHSIKDISTSFQMTKSQYLDFNHLSNDEITVNRKFLSSVDIRV